MAQVKERYVGQSVKRKEDAELITGQGRYTEAELLIVPGYEGMKAHEDQISDQGRPLLREAAERVVRLYEEWNRPDQAAVWKARLGLPDLPADVFARP